MKKKLSELKPKYHPDLSSIPHPGQPKTTLRKLIYKYFIKDLKKDIDRGAFFCEEYFDDLGLESGQGLEIRNEFKSIIRGSSFNDEDRFLVTLREFMDSIWNQSLPEYSKYLLVPPNPENEEEDEIDRIYTDKKDEEFLHGAIDVRRFEGMFFQYGIEIESDTKLPLFYLILIAVYHQILPDTLTTDWLLPVGGKPPKILQYKKEMSFWERLYIAYKATGLTDSMLPFFILRPPVENEKIRLLESILSDEPQYYLRYFLKNMTWQFGDRRTEQRYSYKDEISDKIVTVTLPQDLIDYPGVYIENRKAWKLYQSIMGHQGPINEEDLKEDGFKKAERPGFIHFLVDALSTINEKRKYGLSSMFLRGYFGIDISSNAIKAHLKPRKPPHK